MSYYTCNILPTADPADEHKLYRLTIFILFYMPTCVISIGLETDDGGGGKTPSVYYCNIRNK